MNDLVARLRDVADETDGLCGMVVKMANKVGVDMAATIGKPLTDASFAGSPTIREAATHIEQLEEALRPFAKIAELRERYNDEENSIICVTVKLCWEARQALASRDEP